MERIEIGMAPGKPTCVREQRRLSLRRLIVADEVKRMQRHDMRLKRQQSVQIREIARSANWLTTI